MSIRSIHAASATATATASAICAGIASRLEYLQRLGVDIVWLSPVYRSPNDDNGYDISDYRAINEEFGTMADFDRMLAEIHGHGIKLMMDLVVNHTSDEHEWFRQARSSRENPFHDFYIWHEPVGGREPNNWASVFGGSAWAWNEATGSTTCTCFRHASRT